MTLCAMSCPKADSVRWTCAFCPHAWQNSPASGAPQFRQAPLCVRPSASPARGSTARARIPPVAASPIPSRSDIKPPATVIRHSLAPMLAAGGMKRVGLLGGSFNPAHRGHRRISLAAIEALGLDEIWWLVSPGNPLKPAKGMAPYEARVESAREQAKGTRIKVSDFERQAGTRYTVDTLTALKRRYPDHRFIWLMGADTVAQFHQWRSWR